METKLRHYKFESEAERIEFLRWVFNLVLFREDFRYFRNFKIADEIRTELNKFDISLKDHAPNHALGTGIEFPPGMLTKRVGFLSTPKPVYGK